MLEIQIMEALGNEFIVVDAISQSVNQDEEPHIIKKCLEQYNFDQLLLIEPPTDKSADLKLKIYNVDGSLAENCINGVRAIALYAFDENLVSENHLLLQLEKSLAKITKTDDALFSVEMKDFSFAKASCDIAGTSELKFDFEGKTISFEPVAVGNPHAVVFQEVNSEKIPEIGAALQESNIYQKGVNVGFVSVVESDEIDLRVVERGVGETLACGSGACAAALCGVKNGLLDSPTKVNFQKGHVLVDVNLEENSFKLTGGATYKEKSIKISL